MVHLRKQLILHLLLSLLPFSFLQAQTSANSPYIPSIIPPSPNAAALMKFTDVPVSTYTGTADITVPIHTIKAKGITVPVSLSYHTGGIRVKEEASWVGLGWTLNAGGMISRTIMGSDDFGTQGPVYFTNAVPQLPGDISSVQPLQDTTVDVNIPHFIDFFCNYLVNTSAGTEDFWQSFTTATNPYDMEPDIFSYNFPGHSGKFILTRAGQVVMQKQENIKIQYQGSGSNVTFSVTDDQGNTFYFNVLERTAMTPNPAQPISSWLLSKIVTQQQDSVLFNYVSGGATVSSRDELHETWGRECTALNGYFPTNTPSPTYFNQTLQSIDFSDGNIQFAFDSTRLDLQGAYKLDSVMIFSKDPQAGLTYLRQNNFYYSYFNDGAVITDTLENYRLRLDSVKELSGSTALPPYSFVYNNPNPSTGAAKHGFNVDHWGYFNNAGNGPTGTSATFIPTTDINFNPISNPAGGALAIHYDGANRGSAFPAMQTFSLQQVNYPTGGKTVLAYQANDFDYTNSEENADHSMQYVQTTPITFSANIRSHGTTTGTFDMTHIYPTVQPPQTNATVSVAFRYQNNNDSTYRNTVGKIRFTINGTDYDINAATHSGGGPVFSIVMPIGFANTTYTWTAYIDPSIDTNVVFEDINVGISATERILDYNLLQFGNGASLAGGLRVQSVTHYTDASHIASQKVYTYDYYQDKLGTGTPQQYSYGRLMSTPSYARYAITGLGPGYCTALALYGSSITSLTSAATGNIVGYDQVTESTVDPASGQDIGKTVYTYFNSPDTGNQWQGYSLPGLLNISNNLNGQLLSKIDYAAVPDGYSPVAETDNYFHTTNRAVYYSPKFQYAGSGTTTDCRADTSVESQTNAWFYPSIKSERILLDSTRKIVYQQGDASHSIRTTTANFYDNPVHYQLTRSSTIDSKGDTVVTLLKYPQDYISPGNTATGNAPLDSLIGRNMVSTPVEKRDSLYYPGSSAGYVTGAQLNLYRLNAGAYPAMVADKTYKLDISAPITNFTPFSFSGNTVSMDSRNRQMVSFDQYDDYNNLRQYTSTDQNPVTIVWDYNHVYPVAQVKNATADQVAYTSFEDGAGGWAVQNPLWHGPWSGLTGAYYYDLHYGACWFYGLDPAKKYIVSYWAYDTSPETVNGSIGVKQGKQSFMGFIYYEHTVTGVSSTFISGAAPIDELRLYPANAQMTTYTYYPGVGMIGQCDPNNKISYYFYDGFGRLGYIKDQDNNVIKTYQYHYANQ